MTLYLKDIAVVSREKPYELEFVDTKEKSVVYGMTKQEGI